MLTVKFSLLKIERGDRILDLGCGQGRHIHHLFLDRGVMVYGLDRDLSSLRIVEKTCREFSPHGEEGRNWLVLQGVCECLPFKENSFDHIIVSEVLEHIQDYKGVLKGISKSLKGGGNLVISVPRFWPERICWALSPKYHEEEGGHIRIFKASSLKLEVEKMGFRCFKVHYAHALHTPYWWLKCMRWERRDRWWPVKLYHRFLVWDILRSPRPMRWLEGLLNPIIGKSVVLYFKKVE